MKMFLLALAVGFMAFAPPSVLAQAPGDTIPGEYKWAQSSSSDGTWRTGSVIIRKQGPFYTLTFKGAELRGWQGIACAVPPSAGANTELWAAIGTQEMVSLGIYQAHGGSFRGVWYPLNAADDPSLYGSETMVGAPILGGRYDISGKLPNGGDAYTGVLKIEPGATMLNGDGQTCLFKWSTGTRGAAFRTGDLVAVCAGWGADYQIVRFRIESGNLSGEFYGRDQTKGSYTLTK